MELHPLLSQIEKLLSSRSGEKYTINLQRKPWGSEYLKEIFIRYHDHANICYSVTLNRCWRRFVVCKESAHLLIDDDPKKQFTVNPTELVQQLITGASSLTTGESMKSERLAVFAAIEMLMPWETRNQIDKTKSDLEIATQFVVPQNMVNLLVRSRYWDISAECHSDFDI